MQDEYNVMETGNFQAIVNAFTQGLRELPTDYVARVKNFLAEYLGTSRHPVPFGGRVRDFEHLDAWLADTQAPPYLLLAAPAGRGKSALLVRWCQRLHVQRNLAIAYFPVSIRFATNLAGVAFPSLVALLASLHGEKVPADPNLHEDVWRSLLAEYLTRPLPDGRSLLLVLDGVDEAADWAAGPSLFPLNPPPGLHIVLSARYLANDQDADAWLKRLGWTRPGFARTLELYPLDRTGIANVLQQMGFPLDLLSSRVNIVSELYRLSEGDPLLVRLYIDDLWERGEAAVRFQPEDLHIIRPGLAGYFERWWKDQRLLWSKDAPQREATAQIVLNLLAGALGPLSKNDILSLLPEEADIRAGEIEQHLAPLARFVTGDGIRQGYVFSHPRLANYFLEERLSAEERHEVEQRFLTWGKQTLLALNAGSLAPEHASSYSIQYYGAHLERAQADASTLLVLVSDGWRRAWEKLDRANAGFLGDVERARRVAEREDEVAIRAGNLAPHLGGEVRSLLSQVSVNSMTSNISPRLMLEAVKTGIWTPAQGLACIRLISDLRPRAKELVGLAPYVQEPLRTDILQEALDTIAAIKDEYVRLDTLVEVATGFSEELLWQVLEFIPEIEDEADRAGVVSELASALSPYKALIDRTLDLVQEMEDEEYRALALEGLAPCFSQDQHSRILQLTERIEEERYRAPVLKALIPYLSASLLQNILQEARAMRDGLARIRLFTELVTCLSGSLQAEVVQEILELTQDIEDREYRVEVQSGLAPFLSADRLRSVLEEVNLLWDESYQVRALSDLLPYLPEELLPDFQQIVLELKNEQYRMKVLIQLLPHLSQELLARTLESVQTIWDEGYRAELLAHIARCASQDLVPRLLEVAGTIKDQGYRVWLLAEFESPLAGKLPTKYSDVLRVFKVINTKEQRLQTLLAIVPRLSEGALAKIFDFILPEVFGFTWSTHSEEQQAHILAKLASRLPENWLPTVIAMIRAMRQEVYQVQVLVALAPRIGKTLLSEALAIVRAMEDRERRSQVLETLVTSLPDEHKAQRVQEMLQVLQVIKDEAERVRFIEACVPYLPAPLPAEKMREIIEAVQTMREEKNKANTLRVLAPQMPEELFDDVLNIVEGMQHEELLVPLLEVLVAQLTPKMFQRMFSHILQIAQNIQNERWRTRILTAIVAHAPEDLIVEILEKVQDKNWRTGMLSALIPYVTEKSFYQLWEAMQAIPDERGRALVMGALSQRMPADFFPQLWQTLQTLNQERQIWVLRALLAHMPESQFEQVWNAVRASENQEQREYMQEILLAHVPKEFFAQVWSEMQISTNAGVSGKMLLALAPRVSEEFFLQFLTATLAISHEVRRFQVLEALAPHVPDEFFPQFFMAILALPDKGIRIRGLMVATPYIPAIPAMPESLFEQAWETLQTIPGTKVLADLVAHAPRSFLAYLWEDVRTKIDIAGHIQLILAFIPYLVPENFIEVLEVIEELPYGSGLVEVLELLVPLLTSEQCVEVLTTLLSAQVEEQLSETFMRATWERIWQIRALAVLVPALPNQRLTEIVPVLLQGVRALNAEDQSWVTAKLASRIPEDLLKEALETIWLITFGQYRVQALKILLPTLSQDGWAEVFELVKARMYATGNALCGLELLEAASSLAHLSPSPLLYAIVYGILRLFSERERRETLLDLARLVPIVRVCGGEEAVLQGLSALVEVGQWWP